jgi:hypothetical protein
MKEARQHSLVPPAETPLSLNKTTSLEAEAFRPSHATPGDITASLEETTLFGRLQVKVAAQE